MKNLDPFSLEARIARLERLEDRIRYIEEYVGIEPYRESSLDSRLERLEDWIRDHT